MGGRRLPYLLYGTLIAVIVMILMPNSGSFGFGYASLAALSFGALMIALLDVSSNMAMQPFKMMVGDMVNEEQKSYAYGIQSFLANTDAVVAAILPFVFAYIGLANTAEKGVVPQTVVVAFYVGAALLIITSAFTISKVKEYDPETYARYHGIDVAANQEKANWFELLKTAPKVFLDGYSGTVFLLVRLPVYVDLLGRRDCRKRLAHYRCVFRRPSGGGQPVRRFGGGVVGCGGDLFVYSGKSTE